MGNERIEELRKDLNLLTTDDVINLTGWCPPTVNKLMNNADFPTIKIGKKNMVLYDSFKKFLSERRELRGVE